MKKYLIVLLTALLLSFGGVVNATPIGWSAGTLNGHALITSDMGIQYLSPTSSMNMSHPQIDNLFTDSNSNFYGFSYATNDDIHSLFQAYDSSYAPVASIVTYDFTAAMDIINDFGSTFHPDNNNLRLTGMTSELSPNGSWYTTKSLMITPSVGTASIGTFNQWFDAPSDVAGSWLVRQSQPGPPAPTPEPNTLMLFGIGCLSLAGYSRRRKA